VPPRLWAQCSLTKQKREQGMGTLGEGKGGWGISL